MTSNMRMTRMDPELEAFIPSFPPADRSEREAQLEDTLH